MKLRAALVLTSLVLTAYLRPADAKPCERWNSFITKCQVVSAAICNQSEQLWTWEQRHNWYNWLYSDTADRACNKHVAKWFPGKEDLTEAIVVSPGVAVCMYDWDDDGDIRGYLARDIPPRGHANDYDHTHTTITTQNMQTEPECDLVPHGDYADDVTVVGPPVSGGSFSDSVRKQVRQINSLYSPVSGKNISDAPSDPLQYPEYNRQTLPPYEDDYSADEPDTIEPTWQNTTQIDHIIPRKDIYGCPCGTNSPANAAVVSGGHNNAMSNRMDHPGRIELLLKYTNYTPPPRVATGSGDGSDLALGGGDGDAVTEAGCAAGGGSGTMWSGLLVIGALMLRRRSPSRRSWE